MYLYTHNDISVSSPYLLSIAFVLFIESDCLLAQLVKYPLAMRVIWFPSLGWEDPPQKGKATHSSILAWRIPWILWSIGLQRVRHD